MLITNPWISVQPSKRNWRAFETACSGSLRLDAALSWLARVLRLPKPGPLVEVAGKAVGRCSQLRRVGAATVKGERAALLEMTVVCRNRSQSWDFVSQRPLSSGGRNVSIVGALVRYLGTVIAAMRLSHLVAFTVCASLPLMPAHTHQWYPLECCSHRDCAPVDTVVRRGDGSYLLTAGGVTVVIPADYPHWRRSPDGHVHVCIQRLKSGGILVVCAFRGPGM